MPKWRYVANEGSVWKKHTHVDDYDNMLKHEEEGLQHLAWFLKTSKSNYGERLRWVALERQDDTSESWIPVKKLPA